MDENHDIYDDREPTPCAKCGRDVWGTASLCEACLESAALLRCRMCNEPEDLADETMLTDGVCGACTAELSIKTIHCHDHQS